MEGVNANLIKVNPKENLKSTFQIEHAIAAEKGIKLIDLLKGSVSIIADPDMLQLIIRNLINNAIKFTATGGEITVTSEIIDDVCRIAVRDNGTGISYDQQNDIFSLKTKTTYGTRNEKGVGLGLVLCKEFTELQNGKISFESVPGFGTTFYVSFKIYRDISDIDIPKKEKLIKKV